MQTAAPKPDKVETIGKGLFFCILVAGTLGILTAKGDPVPIEVRGCYKSGAQTLQVESKRIIVNGNPIPEVDIEYSLTNLGRQINMLDGSSLVLDQAKPPYKQIGHDMIISVQDNALIAFIRKGEAIPFGKVARPNTCASVVDPSSPP